MAVMTSPNRLLAMEQLLSKLKETFPQLRFSPGSTFLWSPETNEVFYDERKTVNNKRIWSLLHETGHALLGHKSYQADIELLKLEVAAWQKAQEIASDFGIKIDEEHIQDCLDTYRDWLHARSICPTCTTRCLQQSDMHHYRCHNCHTTWKVTPSRFARAYRSVKQTPQTSALLHANELSL